MFKHGKPEKGSSIVDSERWHRTSYGGSLRAAVFGVNDGLLSNFGLVMGIVGTNAEPRFVLLAGVAGLLAGAFSMAAGEYVSVRSQRELYEQQLELERQELESSPEEEHGRTRVDLSGQRNPRRSGSGAGAPDSFQSGNGDRDSGA